MNKLTLLPWTLKRFLFLTVFALSSEVNATTSQFTYKAASPTVAAVNLQKVEGGHLERFQMAHPC